jgi:hypothetical protein
MGQGSPHAIDEQRGASERKHGLLHQAAGLSPVSILWTNKLPVC